MTRTEIINHLIEKHEYKSYLEIGMDDPNLNYLHINCENKESCDPYMNDEFDGHYDHDNLPDIVKENLTFHMTSDEMFKSMPFNKKYDIIFIDGLHEANQCYRDIYNSLHHLNPNGIIVVHDCLPRTKESAEYPRTNQGEWNGSTWQSIFALRTYCGYYEIVDTDYGVGLIPYQDLSPYEIRLMFPEYEQIFSDTNVRNEVMHVISEQQFLERY